jgi:hypothetical protein
MSVIDDAEIKQLIRFFSERPKIRAASLYQQPVALVDFFAIFQEKRKKILNYGAACSLQGKKSPGGDFWGL